MPCPTAHPTRASAYSVLLELQAGCFAGAPGRPNSSRTTDANGQPLFKSLTTQNIQDTLNAATAVGNDTIQQRSGMRVDESSFTHSSSARREQWTYKGYSTGDPRQCDTFGTATG